jgi:two-component sensor histidine kinase
LALQSPARSESALALAVITASTAPVLLLDDDLRVVAASTSFGDAFEIDALSAAGLLLRDLGDKEWDAPQLSALLTATAAGYAPVDAYQMDLHRQGRTTRNLQLNARKLDYGDGSHGRMLLTVSDVTDDLAAGRQIDQLLRDKDVLLQEVQHRVANSLQIIASVLMQSARKVQSEETRGHLRDAHSRVMSIAAVQHQLSASTLSDVQLQQYFTQLCVSLAASMIHDPKEIVLETAVDDSAVKADVSVSLGLIVTELVINALKHAFPHNRQGKIIVSYRAEGERWTLSVSDDGIGMTQKLGEAKAGLGTSIVEALANKLKARVETADASPGTIVSIVHA